MPDEAKTDVTIPEWANQLVTHLRRACEDACRDLRDATEFTIETLQVRIKALNVGSDDAIEDWEADACAEEFSRYRTCGLPRDHAGDHFDPDWPTGHDKKGPHGRLSGVRERRNQEFKVREMTSCARAAGHAGDCDRLQHAVDGLAGAGHPRCNRPITKSGSQG